MDKLDATPKDLLTVDPDVPVTVSDGDFVIESGSPPLTAPPDDTTLEPSTSHGITAPEPTADAEEPAEEPASPAKAAKPAAVAKAEPAAKGGKAKGKSLADREADLRSRVDRTTYELRESERKLAELTRQINEAAAKVAGPAAKPDAKPADAAPAPTLELPEPPDYRQFDTDEAYEAARKEYHGKVNAALAAHAEAIKREVASSLDSRIEGQTVERTMRDTLTRAQAKYPDWTEKADALKEVRSSWYDPKVHGMAQQPFLADIVQTLIAQGDDQGPDLLHFLGSDPERAQVLADLRPTRAIRDALVTAPAIQPLLEYFATDEGSEAFEALRRMQPVRVFHAIGALSFRLAGASSGSPTKPVAPITKAQPSARPPVGEPGAQTRAANPANKSFDAWMAEEDAKERAAALKAAGIAV